MVSLAADIAFQRASAEDVRNNLVQISEHTKCDHAVRANFTIHNFTKSACEMGYFSGQVTPIGTKLFEGELASDSIRMETEQTMKFTAQKVAWSIYGTRGRTFFDIAGKLLVVQWDVPYMSNRNYSWSFGLLGTYQANDRPQVVDRVGPLIDHMMEMTPLLNSIAKGEGVNHPSLRIEDDRIAVQASMKWRDPEPK